MDIKRRDMIIIHSSHTSLSHLIGSYNLRGFSLLHTCENKSCNFWIGLGLFWIVLTSVDFRSTLIPWLCFWGQKSDLERLQLDAQKLRSNVDRNVDYCFDRKLWLLHWLELWTVMGCVWLWRNGRVWPSLFGGWIAGLSSEDCACWSILLTLVKYIFSPSAE